MKRRCRFSIEVHNPDSSESKAFYAGTGLDFALSERALLECVPQHPSRRTFDLLRIASSMFFTDRIVKRKRRGGPASWPRRMSLSIEVNEPEFWKDQSNYDQLVDVLSFVSGDSWSLSFDRQTDEYRTHVEWQPPLCSDIYPSNPRLCLYSGGLDSAAGLAMQLSELNGDSVVPITVRHRSDLAEKVRSQIKSLHHHFGGELHPVVVPFEMRSPAKLVRSEETSQRSRAFLFVAVGAAVADGFGASQLEMYESGVGAINAPLLAGMDGSQATRSAHPHFLHQVSQLLSKVLERDFEVVLPFFTLTKGELVRSLSQADLWHVAKATCSCSSYPVRVQKSGPQQSCGVCAACLFRRVAMNSAGIEEDASVYQYDFLNSKVDIPTKKLRCLTAFLNQIDSLVGVERGELPVCIVRHLRQTHVIDRTETVQPIIDLYRRYRVEWAETIRRAESVGCKWTKMINLPPQAA